MALAKPTTVNTTASEIETVAVESTIETTGAEQMASDSVVVEETVAEEVAVEQPEPSVAQPEPVVQEVAVVEQVVNQVAVKREAGVPIASGAKFEETMADEGFEGLVLDGFSFDTITLPAEGTFQLAGDEDSNLGKSFIFTPESSRSRYIVKFDDDKDAEHYYSYVADGTVKQDGSCAKATLAQWAADMGEDDYKPVIKKYLDVVATIQEMEADVAEEYSDAMIGNTVMLSISPSGLSRFSGAMARALKTGAIGSFDLEATVGRKVKGKGGSFYPWNFKLVK